MQLILLGAPGSGKGVQADLLIKHYQIVHISTGNILRKAIEEKTKLGLEAMQYMDKGLLVPDSLIMQILDGELSSSQSGNGFVMDGVPRTIPQAELLEQRLMKSNRPINRVIYLDVSPDILIQRLTNRRTCVKCNKIFNLLDHPPQNEGICDNCGSELVQRVDDRESTVRKRLEVYESQTKPLLSFYEKRHILIIIPGNRSPNDVFQLIKQQLN